ncbi:MAG: cysteine desulfurase-like protein [Rubripirellula sp.]
MLSKSDVLVLRNQFPALSKQVDHRTAVYFDGPAGTQVPERVIDAISNYLRNHNANHGGVFQTSVESDQVVDEAHRAAAELVGSPDPSTIAFGANMTSLTFALSRALAQSWQAGDEIVVSRLEHDANFTPWILAARDAGATVRYIDINETDCTLQLEQYQETINDRTRLVAVGCASNAVGTINPVKQICHWARQVGALTFLDAVHYAPHGLMDVVDWDCDFLACSAYKFFGPHVGILYGRKTLLESIQPYKLRPSPNDLPGKWMTGTQNFACLAGTLAAIDYLADIGRLQETTPPQSQPDNPTLRPDAGSDQFRRSALARAYDRIGEYERSLLKPLLSGLASNPHIKIWGIADPDRSHERCPTLSITHDRWSPRELAQHLSEVGIFVWHGNYYALPLTERLGVEPSGMVRIGITHYNTQEEIERLLDRL